MDATTAAAAAAVLTHVKAGLTVRTGTDTLRQLTIIMNTVKNTENMMDRMKQCHPRHPYTKYEVGPMLDQRFPGRFTCASPVRVWG